MSTDAVTLVHLGPGDPGLVTIRARDALRAATFVYVVGADGADTGDVVGLASSLVDRAAAGTSRVVRGAPPLDVDLRGAVIAHGAALADVLAATAIAEACAARAQLLFLRVPGVTLDAHAESIRSLPLRGKRVLTLRAKEQAQDAEVVLHAYGASPLSIPALVIAPPPDPARLEQAVREAASYAFIVFTSANGVERFFDVLCTHLGKDARALAPARIAAIGPKTAEALLSRGVRADLVAKDFVGEALARELQQQLGGTPGAPGHAPTRILLPRALVARDVVPDTLRALGHTVDVVPAYETLGPATADAERIRGAFAAKEVFAVLFTSSSTVTHVVAALGADAASILASVCVVSIGPVTSKTAAEHGIRVDVTASVYTVSGAVSALSRFAGHAAGPEPGAPRVRN